MRCVGPVWTTIQANAFSAAGRLAEFERIWPAVVDQLIDEGLAGEY